MKIKTIKTKLLFIFCLLVSKKLNFYKNILLARMECKMSDIKMLGNEKRKQYEDEIEYIKNKLAETGQKLTLAQKRDWESLIIYRKMLLAQDTLFLEINAGKLTDSEYNLILKESFNLIGQYESFPRVSARRQNKFLAELNSTINSTITPCEHSAIRAELDSVINSAFTPCENFTSSMSSPHSALLAKLMPLPKIPLVENPPLPHINWCLPQPGDDLDDLYA